MKKEKNKIKSAPEVIKPKNNIALYVAGFVIILAISFAYSPSNQADFVNLDDHQYILKNDNIKDISFANISKLFYAPAGDMYIPLVNLSYAIEYYFFDLDAHRYHTNNILLHILNSLLILWLIWMLTKNLFVSFSMAGLFALHPFHVESVAWLSERKDVLYTLFFIASIISYHFYSQKKLRKYYVFSLLFFLLSCMSKSMAVTLPAVLLIYDYFYLHQRSWKIIINKIHFFIGALVFAIVTIKMIGVSFHDAFNANYTLFDKTIMVLYSVFFYMQKALLPINLSAMYTYPLKTGAVVPLYYILCAIGTVLIIGFITFSKYVSPVVRACFLFYLITVFPILQFFANTYTVTADRYSYVPVLGIFGIIIYYLNKGVQNKRISEIYAWATMLAILLVLSISTNSRSKVWNDDLSLFSDIIEKGQYTEAAICGLGDAYIDKGEYQKALPVLEKADSLYPNKSAVKNRYASALSMNGQYDKAIEQYLRCLTLDQTLLATYVNLGDAYLKTGKKEEALKIFLKGLSVNPDDNTCLYDVGYAYWSLENREEAIKYFRKAASKHFQPAINFLSGKNISIN